MRLFLGASVLFIPAVFAQMTGYSSDGNTITITITFDGPRMFGMQSVTGAPYSADQISEHSQTLANGTHIARPQTAQHMFRDSQGRTRTERQMFRGLAASNV